MVYIFWQWEPIPPNSPNPKTINLLWSQRADHQGVRFSFSPEAVRKADTPEKLSALLWRKLTPKEIDLPDTVWLHRLVASRPVT